MNWICTFNMYKLYVYRELYICMYFFVPFLFCLVQSLPSSTLSSFQKNAYTYTVYFLRWPLSPNDNNRNDNRRFSFSTVVGNNFNLLVGRQDRKFNPCLWGSPWTFSTYRREGVNKAIYIFIHFSRTGGMNHNVCGMEGVRNQPPTA